MHPTIEDTVRLVVQEHGKTNQTDKSGRTPYYWHLIRVMIRLGKDATEDQQHIALLHDTLEDTHLTEHDLRRLGYRESIITGVKLCSNNDYKHLSYANWMTTIANSGNVDSIKTKIADCSDNLSFGRMVGLLHSKVAKHVRPKPAILNLADRIFKRVNYKMYMPNESAMYPRFYKALEKLTQALPQHEIDQLNLMGFGFVGEYQTMKRYIPKEEFVNYAQLNSVRAWKDTLTLTVLTDRNKQQYIGFDVDKNTVEPYMLALHSHVDRNLDVFVEKQQARDGGRHHITVITPQEYGKMQRYNPNGVETVLNHIGSQFTVNLYGVGSISDEKNQTFYILSDSGGVNSLRAKLNLPEKDLHCTLAFNEKDVFSKVKNSATEIVKFDEVWRQFANTVTPTVKNTFSLK